IPFVLARLVKRLNRTFLTRPGPRSGRESPFASLSPPSLILVPGCTRRRPRLLRHLVVSKTPWRPRVHWVVGRVRGRRHAVPLGSGPGMARDAAIDAAAGNRR